MSVEVTYEKIMMRGRKMFKIVRLSALPEKKLPMQYVENTAAFWLTDDGKSFFFRYGGNYLSKGEVLTPEFFKIYISKMKKGGELLQKINEKIKKTAAVWHGVETIKI